MLLDDLRQLQPQFQALLNRYGASRLRVFGSVARGEETLDSDIDFLVSFPKGYDLFKQRLPLASGLQNLVKRNVDLIPEHELNVHLREHILNEAINL